MTTTTQAPGRPYWREALAPYSRPDLRRSLLDLATSVVPYLALMVAMYLLLDVSYWLTLLVAVPAAGFLLRAYIIFHDCTHGSFMPTKAGNTWLGRIVGLIVFSPFTAWKQNHAIHHATAGDLDRRGIGDVQTLTVAEYLARDKRGRLGYRLFRHPLVMFGIGPLYALALYPRFIPKRAKPRQRNSIIATDIALVVVIGAVCWAIGWKEYLLIQLPTAYLAATAGVWLFYVQHQFEDVYWKSSDEWDYAEAALQGSSYLKLPKVLQFFTGNIGLHHVHHLSARVPNYKLQAAHDNVDLFDDVPVLTFWDGIKTTRLKLWDEERGRLVTFADAERRPEHVRPTPEVATGAP
jgi:omega-6 fatty acid desaturase (delta-12 desaturase)